jgi:2'-5' RNA ligase
MSGERRRPRGTSATVGAHLDQASLWLVPDGADRDRLSALIAGLAERLGTTPFAPHVTLLSRVHGEEADLVAATSRLAGGLRPVTVRLGSIEGREEHFRCLFARAVDTGALVAAHVRAAAAFALAPDTSFFPHLSLVYGTLSAETKRAIGEAPSTAVASGFEARRIALWATSGPEADWIEVAAFPLDGGPASALPPEARSAGWSR